MDIRSLRGVVERDRRAMPEEVLRRAEAPPRGPAAARPPAAPARAAIGDARLAARTAHLSEGGRRASRTELERMLGTNDLVDMNYLHRGIEAGKSVCRILLRDAAGRPLGSATGFKVSPGLLLTNHHVLPEEATAARALAEFDHELDIQGRPRPTTVFRLLPGALFLADAALDIALVALDPRPAAGAGVPIERYGWLRLNPEVAKINEEIEFVTLIQHPSGMTKQVAVRENRLIRILDPLLWYASDTAPGSSGAPVLNDSWQVVGLHRSGVPRTDDQGRWLRRDGRPADDETEDSEIDWIANAGVRASRIVERVRRGDGAAGAQAARLLREFLEAAETEAPVEATTGRVEEAPGGGAATLAAAAGAAAVQAVPGGVRLVLPLAIDIRLGGGAAPAVAAVPAVEVPPQPGIGVMPPMPGTAVLPAEPGAAEAFRIPWIDRSGYGNRQGYRPDFLLTPEERAELAATGDAARRAALEALLVPFPRVESPQAQCALLPDGGHVIPYHHFSVVMHRPRRLALVTAANVDHRKASQEPEAGRDYSRRALGGLGKYDKERWITDERIPQDAQLPDRFFTEDRGSFDKGHLVRREDVCWGESWEAVRRANGDTYHTTNCSPQVSGFNQAMEGGIWGELENLVGREGREEPYCVLAGPVLSPRDRLFQGEDEEGRRIAVRIPRRYWKVILARAEDGGAGLEAFGFVLEQDLGGVDWEFAPPAEWRPHMEALPAIEALIARSGTRVEFGAALRAADQAEREGGRRLRERMAGGGGAGR